MAPSSSGEGHSPYSRCRGRTWSTPIRVRHRRSSCPKTIRMIQSIGSRRSPGGAEVKHGGHSQCSRFPNCNQKSVRPGRRRRNFRHWLYSHSEGYRTDWCTSQEQEQEQVEVEAEVEVEVEVEVEAEAEAGLTRRRLWLSASHGGGWAEAARRTSRENHWSRCRAAWCTRQGEREGIIGSLKQP